MKINKKLSSKCSKIKVKKYLDKTEKFVVEFCKKNGIEYTFTYSKNAHHYNFPNGMIDVQNYENREMVDLFSNAKPFVYTVVAQTFWKKVCALFHEETIAEKLERENIEFIKRLGHKDQDELLKLAISYPVEDDDKSNLTWHYPSPQK